MNQVRWGVYGPKLLHITVLHRSMDYDSTNSHALCTMNLRDGLEIRGFEVQYQQNGYRKCKRCVRMNEKGLKDTPKCTYTQPVI